MKTLTIEILEDLTDTGGFGVEGYEIKLTSKFGSIDAFINMRNIVTTGTGVFIHNIFETCPHKGKIEYIKSINSSIQEAFKNWNPEIRSVQVDI